MKTRRILTALLLGGVLLTTGCAKDDGLTGNGQYGIFDVSGNTVLMDGVVGSNSLDDFNQLLSENPDVNRVDIRNCDGSEDDEINLQLSRVVHARNMDIHLMDNATIASGGVDFFLAGNKRTRGSNTRMGVHSWASGNGSNTIEARDFPRGHQEHEPYIAYFQAIGMTRTEAEDFYYFTINAASSDNMHWMTEAEIEKYKMLN